MSVGALTDRELGPPPFPIRKFTVAEYHRMIEIGLLKEDDRVELLEGWIVPKMTHNPPHDGTIQLVTKRLLKRLPTGWDFRIQSAMTTVDSEPEPDIAIVRGDEMTYLERHPHANDIGLLVEIAESSVEKDSREKARIYARAGVAHYWVVNLVDRCVEVFGEPSGPVERPSYGNHARYLAGQLVPFILDGAKIAEIPARDLLP